MNNLITLHTQVIAGTAEETVSARELHAFLGSKQDFSTWIKARIEDYGFQERHDFVKVKDQAPQKNGAEESSTYENWTVRIEYYITLDMAKELAMVERNEKGKQARRYFIECEKRLLADRLPATARDPDDITVHTNNFIGLVGALKAIGLDNAVAAAGANAAVTKLSGVNILALTGNTYLESSKQERWFTPTQLGNMLTPTRSGKAMNTELAKAGMQYKEDGDWIATDLGKPYAHYLTVAIDGGRKMRQHLHWSVDILKVIGLK